MPVWQQFYLKHLDAGVQIISVAIDAQGAEKAQPFVDKAGATFTTLVDEENLLSRTYGFKAIPNALFIDEEGVIRYKKYGGFDIGKAEFRLVAEEWANAGAVKEVEPNSGLGTSAVEHSEAMELFHKGMSLYRIGQVDEALALWREGVALEPDTYVIRKQIWAVEHPDKFYDGAVDYGWQKEQMAKGL